ncbi:MAG: DUF4249 family protein [Bacteroidales bacterium]|nr:DUF4249 family protein [Bacteroidales bacterium]
MIKKYIFVSGLFILSLVVLTSCETDFDTIAGYKDITVVYGMLDQKDSVIYLKINKAFLGEGNSLIYAQEADSSNYPNQLDVKIEEWNSGQLVRTFDFDTTMIYEKEPGTFYYPEQVIYKSKPFNYYKIVYSFNIFGDTLSFEKFWLNDESTYRLFVTNPLSGNQVTAETGMVHDFDITRPGLNQFIKFTNSPDAQTEFRWDKAENGGKYEIKIVFNYAELNINNQQDTIRKQIVIASGTSYPKPSDYEMYFYLKDQEFFNICLDRIPLSNGAESDIKERYSGTVEIYVAVANETFTLYLQVYEPSTSIVQEKPQFTNIENGTGIFASRYNKVKSKRIHTETVTELRNLGLKFVY